MKSLPGGIAPFQLVLQQHNHLGCMALATGFLSGKDNWRPDALGFGEAGR